METVALGRLANGNPAVNPDAAAGFPSRVLEPPDAALLEPGPRYTYHDDDEHAFWAAFANTSIPELPDGTVDDDTIAEVAGAQLLHLGVSEKRFAQEFDVIADRHLRFAGLQSDNTSAQFPPPPGPHDPQFQYFNPQLQQRAHAMAANFKKLDKGEITTFEVSDVNDAYPVPPTEDPDLASASTDSDDDDRAEFNDSDDAALERNLAEGSIPSTKCV